MSIISSNNLLSKFNKLHINLLQKPSKQTISEYYSELEVIFAHKSSEFDLNLVEYFINPVFNTIKKIEIDEQKTKKPNKEWSDLHELLLKCLILTLENFNLDSSNLFNDILNITSLLLAKNSNKFPQNEPSYSINKISEEFYCSCFQLIQVLFMQASKSRNSEILDRFYTVNNLTTLGLLISTFLDKLIESNSLLVRAEAINSLATISNSNNCLNQNEDINARIGIIFSSFLPGISIKLIHGFLLTQNLKTLNHKAICLSLDFFSNILCRVVGDSLLDTNQYEKSYKACFHGIQNEKLNEKKKSLLVNRSENPEWLTKSIENVFMLINRLFDQLIVINNSNDNDHVKLSLVKFCSLILDRCYLSFNKYANKLLKILIMFAANGHDDENNNDQVSREAKKGMNNKSKFV
jgi:hypothetical protein